MMTAWIIWTSLASIWQSWLWRACWQGGLFTLCVWAICRVWPRLSPALRHGLWLLACVRLLVGLAGAVALPMPLPISFVAPRSAQTTNIDGQAALSTASASPVGWGQSRNPVIAEETGRANPRRVPVASALLILWFAGVGAGIAGAARQAHAVRRLRNGAQPVHTSELAAEARRLGIAFGLSRPPLLTLTSDVTAPQVIGPLRPLVLLPEDFEARFSPDEARLALAHELAHLRRGDLWLAFVPALVRLLFWFFPPAWLACRELVTAREAACDAEALRVTGAQPAVYGKLILKIVGGDGQPAFAGGMGATTAYHTLRDRLLWIQPAPAALRPARFRVGIAVVLALPGFLLLAPWRVASPALLPASASGQAAPPISADPAQIPAQDLRAEGDSRKRYLLIGASRPGQPAPANGYRLLVVLPGGDGGADFQSFVKRFQAWGLPPGYLVAELIAPQWTPKQFENVVWPTQAHALPAARFPTEAFVESVVRDVKQRYPIDPHFVFTLSWASGGPAGYAVSLQPQSQVTGAFIAMSVFSTRWLPSLENASGRAFYLLQPVDANMAPLSMAVSAREQLRARHARVELVTYEGGYGWRKPVYAQIRRGVDWLEAHHAAPISSP